MLRRRQVIGQWIERKAQPVQRRTGLQQQPQLDQIPQQRFRLLQRQPRALRLLGQQGAKGQGVAELQRLKQGLAAGTLAVAGQGHHSQRPLHQFLADLQTLPAPQGRIGRRIQPPHVAEHQLRHRTRQQALLAVGDHVIDKHLGQQHRDRLVAHDPLELRLGRHQVVVAEGLALALAAQVIEKKGLQALHRDPLRHDPAQRTLRKAVVIAAAGDEHQTRWQGSQQLLPGRGRQLREVIHDRDQPLGDQQGLHQLRRQLLLRGAGELVAQPAPHPIRQLLLRAEGGFDQHRQAHHSAWFPLQPPAGDLKGQARLARAAIAAEQQHMASGHLQQGLHIFRLQQPWALRGRRTRRDEAHLQRHMHLAGLHRRETPEGG